MAESISKNTVNNSMRVFKGALKPQFSTCVVYFDQQTGANAKTTFCILLGHKMYKIKQKITKNPGFKGGLPAFRCYS